MRLLKGVVLPENKRGVLRCVHLDKDVYKRQGDSRTVDVHVKRLREKLEGVSDQWALKTVWGVGYKFEVKDPN